MKGKKLSVLGSLKLGGQPCVHMKASCAGIWEGEQKREQVWGARLGCRPPGRWPHNLAAGSRNRNVLAVCGPADPSGVDFPVHVHGRAEKLSQNPELWLQRAAGLTDVAWSILQPRELGSGSIASTYWQFQGGVEVSTFTHLHTHAHLALCQVVSRCSLCLFGSKWVELKWPAAGAVTRTYQKLL